MVDAIVFKVMHNMNAIIQQELTESSSLRQELANMLEIFSGIQMVLEDAERRRLTDIGVRDWLIKLKEVAYDVDDMIDGSILLHRLPKESELHGKSIMNKVRNYFRHGSSSSQAAFCNHISRLIRQLAERLDVISGEKSFHNLVPIIETGERLDCFCRSPDDRVDVFGRDYDMERVIASLLDGGSHQETFSTIAIVGKGGLGKTTLAMTAYSESRVADHFDLRIWVSVHQEFNLRIITKSIIDNATSVNYDLLNFNGMQQTLEEVVSGRRFLLVLDDVWNENQDKWEHLAIPLRRGARGSKVLITTQCAMVHKVFNASVTHKLQALSDNDCWLIIRGRALERDRHRGEFEVVGRDIARKCKGMPILSQALGSLLQTKRSQQEWLYISDDGIWDLSEVEQNNVLPALWLCFSHLPSPLKQCLSYCSIFPKGYVIRKDMLVQLWMGEGFLAQGAGREMEEVGNGYFLELVRRSFFVNAQKDENGEIYSCQMHDLIHDLASFVSRSDCFTIGTDKKSRKDIGVTRSLSLAGPRAGSAIPEIAFSTKSLRTFLVLSTWWENQATAQFAYNNIRHNPSKMFRSCQYLRALDLSGTKIEELPELVGVLNLLRYLDLSYTIVRELPRSITSLHNLQTLRIEQCSKLAKLPKDLGKLTKLRHLCFHHSYSLGYLPVGICKMTCLRTLTRLDLSPGVRSKSASIGELKHLNSLRGTPVIRNIENVSNWEEAWEAKLEDKHNLISLKLSWGLVKFHLYTEEKILAERVLEHLKPPGSLKRLDVINYMGAKFPMWFERMSFIKKVSLVNANHCEQLPTFGSLPLLETLSVVGMVRVKAVSRDFYGHSDVKGFPSLDSLTLQDMTNCELCVGAKEGEMLQIRELNIVGFPMLRSLSSMLGNLNSLETLTISKCAALTTMGESCQQLSALRTLTVKDCPALTALPEELQCLPSLERVQIVRCPKLKTLPQELRHLTSY